MGIKRSWNFSTNNGQPDRLISLTCCWSHNKRSPVALGDWDSSNTCNSIAQSPNQLIDNPSLYFCIQNTIWLCRTCLDRRQGVNWPQQSTSSNQQSVGHYSLSFFFSIIIFFFIKKNQLKNRIIFNAKVYFFLQYEYKFSVNTASKALQYVLNFFKIYCNQIEIKMNGDN